MKKNLLRSHPSNSPFLLVRVGNSASSSQQKKPILEGWLGHRSLWPERRPSSQSVKQGSLQSLKVITADVQQIRRRFSRAGVSWWSRNGRRTAAPVWRKLWNQTGFDSTVRLTRWRRCGYTVGVSSSSFIAGIWNLWKRSESSPFKSSPRMADAFSASLLWLHNLLQHVQ